MKTLYIDHHISMGNCAMERQEAMGELRALRERVRELETEVAELRFTIASLTNEPLHGGVIAELRATNARLAEALRGFVYECETGDISSTLGAYTQAKAALARIEEGKNG